jgi:CheY-like chemotaxis protein
MPNVVLVQANTDDREMYAEYLRGGGYDVVAVGTTDEGLPFAHDCDVLVTGLLVPGSFDGIELIRRTRGTRTRQSTRIVVVTACIVPAMQEAAWQAGCDALLLKPVLPDLLVEQIRRARNDQVR